MRARMFALGLALTVARAGVTPAAAQDASARGTWRPCRRSRPAKVVVRKDGERRPALRQRHRPPASPHADGRKSPTPRPNPPRQITANVAREGAP